MECYKIIIKTNIKTYPFVIILILKELKSNFSWKLKNNSTIFTLTGQTMYIKF